MLTSVFLAYNIMNPREIEEAKSGFAKVRKARTRGKQATGVNLLKTIHERLIKLIVTNGADIFEFDSS